ncbi:MAG: RluA family pseudouridine synthase, partial [Lachnospiraceae bacterium]|nr:RluA family pseudouridine synthase [Lachnospiraceae bacterium]
MDRVLEMIAGTEWDGSSLEKMLLREFHFTRRQISRLKFLPGALQVNCERNRVSRILRAGDRVRVTLPKECRVEETPGQSNSLPQTDTRTLLAKKQAKSADLREESVKTARSADILWDDEDLLVVNKPAGIAVHPSHGHWEDTLLRILEERNAIPSQKETACPSAGQRTPKLYPVGRLDKDTSGLMVFAKHSVAAERLQRKGAVQKTYLAFVYGCFPPEQRVFTIDYPIRRKSGYLNRMEVVWEEIRTGEKIRRPIETRRAEKTESSAEVQAEQEKPLPAIT